MTKIQTIKWQKDTRYNDQKTNDTMINRQAIQWPKDKRCNDQTTNDTMANRQR
jgi:hypothetical protein